ncbi:hypothetical protein [Mesorhizobium sp. M0011]|uniref:hypothetical protein n=1 Tax=Mesorhizobium sp. M0011 TaxID=2956839 RepID=UPI0033390C19
MASGGTSGGRTGLGIWTVKEARARFNDLLAAAAEEGPQEIHDRRRTFVLQMSKLGPRKSARDVLLKGGPLNDDEELDLD